MSLTLFAIISFLWLAFSISFKIVGKKTEIEWLEASGIVGMALYIAFLFICAITPTGKWDSKFYDIRSLNVAKLPVDVYVVKLPDKDEVLQFKEPVFFGNEIKKIVGITDVIRNNVFGAIVDHKYSVVKDPLIGAPLVYYCFKEHKVKFSNQKYEGIFK